MRTLVEKSFPDSRKSQYKGPKIGFKEEQRCHCRQKGQERKQEDQVESDCKIYKRGKWLKDQGSSCAGTEKGSECEHILKVETTGLNSQRGEWEENKRTKHDSTVLPEAPGDTLVH